MKNNKPAKEIRSDLLAKEVAKLLKSLDQRVVFAESCTAGLVASTLGQVPGVSEHLCGSAVVYRAALKRKWLGVRKRTIKAHTTESPEVAAEMAIGVLKKTREAHWSVSVVGHLGPDAPKEKDGILFITVARRTEEEKIKVEHTYQEALVETNRLSRQTEACYIVLKKLHYFLELHRDNRDRLDW